MLRSPVARFIGWASWLGLGCAALAAATALFCQWAVNAEILGARDMGLGLFFAFLGATALIASTYAAPVLAVLGAVTFYFQRRAGLRLLAAGAAAALPVAVLTLLE